jgi:hypothetical protein
VNTICVTTSGVHFWYHVPKARTETHHVASVLDPSIFALWDSGCSGRS